MGHHHEKGNNVLAFLAGAATTALVGGYLLYGPNGRQHRRQLEHWVLKARAEILERMGEVQDLTEEGYHRIVDEVMESYGTAKKIGSERAARLSSRFKSKWHEMREAAQRAADEARDELAEEEAELRV